MPHGPHGGSATILITDCIVVFKDDETQAMAQELTQARTSGQAQYGLDASSRLTPIFQHNKLGIEDLDYANDPFWAVFVDGIAHGGPEPLVEDFRSLQSVFTNMFQGSCWAMTAPTIW